MDTSKLRKFASFARKSLIEQVGTKMKAVLAEGSLARRENAGVVSDLEAKIKEIGKEQTIETVAYTWFNRFCALRYMDVNRYTKIGILSPADGQFLPEILGEAKAGHVDDEMVPAGTREKVLRILDGTDPSDDPQGEAYRLLLVAACNHYHSLMPFLFEKISDYTELLLPDDLLSGSAIPTYTREALLPANCSPEHTEESVEVIGWLYQFYIADKKDDVFAALKKGKKITPENIPAATQLFTPHWIVRYLVENSLGRLWMLNHPESKLAERMDYYIRPEEPETDFLKITSPEELKVCDPACGSGHMLTYAFDLLHAIYEEQGYQPTDVPALILTHNLYGVEIDDRAGALAAFALTMKAREKYRRFLSPGKIVQPNICVLENIKVDPEELDDYMDKVGRDLFTGGLQGVVNQWEEADNFGSLIRPLVADVSEVLELLRERQMGEDLFLAGVHQKVLKALRQADYLSPKYHVVVANPPYMGSKGMNPRMKDFLESNFEEVKSDAFSAFIVRNTELALDRGQLGYMSPFVWMFLASYEDLRTYLIRTKTITSLVQLEYSGFDGATVPICTFTLENRSCPDYEGAYVRLSEFRGAENQGPKTLEAIRDSNCGWFYRTASKQFDRIPGSPVAYWVNNNVRGLFEELPSLSDSMNITGGMTTADNDRFVRLWHEVAIGKAHLSCESREEAIESGRKWFPYNKGGSYRKWYGNREHFVNWFNDGEEIQSTGRAFPRSKDCYFKESLTYTATSSSYFGIRYCPPGAIFDAKGSSCFAGHATLLNGLGFLASDLASYLLAAINPTIEFQTGNLSVLPFATNFDVTPHVEELIETTRDDWDSYEVSWDFSRSPLLTNESSLETRYQELRDLWRSQTNRVIELERHNIQALAQAYGLNGEVETEPPLDSITLECNPVCRYDDDKSDSELESLLLADTMREFISYAVGCMLGRYSLDKPGLILANQGDTLAEYLAQVPEPSFMPDDDNVIPMLDGDWFTDDISERFKEFLKVTFGTEHYAENLKFLEDSLYPENTSGRKRKTIRDYFLKEFYNHHVKLYKKRPIYWLFSSPKGTFNALIYMHCYRPDTVSSVLQYLRDFRDKLAHRRDHQQMVADSGGSTKSEQTKALKEVTTIKKQLKELEDYERETLFPLAQKKIDIDLDDGVKHNYPLFGKALKKVTGLSAKGG
ncbi:type II restriction/modification system DNA methylase subunit YeeA [Rhodopirellula rubra]|uniref:site-specific DNA-methyltransferase (adenine-specific) n=1 Tax=Aporhodopirellula rubra TaxID=980271 RepID=A0A7W5DV21_9BACT|nr:BREX-1 system adenine-specific DNA-methyltransferase PglX [Aporhodopirellula rubra]MBB3204905.1 type II restriction/modification system DNA methylase subunit YeeA [Aporhodopirellula rubra]